MKRSPAILRASPQVGQQIPELDMGPLSLIDFVRWAAYQENWLRLHYDRDYAIRAQLPDAIQSGHFRTALLTRLLTDWLGETGDVRRLRVRHVAPVRVGDTIRCGGRITGVGDPGERVSVRLQIWAVTPDGTLVSDGEADVDVRVAGEVS